MNPRDLMRDARSRLILDLPFFGFLALRLELRQANGLGTCATDGKHLIYDPAMLSQWSAAELNGIIAHEIMHCVSEHFLREDEHCIRVFGYSYTERIKRQSTLTSPELDELRRIHEIWNRAGDYTINLIIKDMDNKKLQLPSDALIDQVYRDKNTEQVFNILWKETDGGRKGNPAPRWGLVQPNTDKNKASAIACKEIAREWKIAVKGAAKHAQQQGKLPGGLEQFIDELLTPKISWRAVLWDFVERVSSNDYSWAVPRRKYLAHGIYLPSMISDEIPLIVFATDTSGSMFDEEIQQAGGELQSILNTFNTTLMAIFVDADIKDKNIRIFYQGDSVDISFEGRGGTDFRPVFEYIEKNGIEPSCLIYLTDMCGDFPDKAPDYPVLWIDTRDNGGNPFGDRIVMEVEGCGLSG